MARRIYNATPEREREKKKATLASMLSVSERTVRDWLSRIDKDTKEARDKRIFAAWLACCTHREIAADEGISEDASEDAVSRLTADLPESGKAAAKHAFGYSAEFLDTMDLGVQVLDGQGHEGPISERQALAALKDNGGDRRSTEFQSDNITLIGVTQPTVGEWVKEKRSSAEIFQPPHSQKSLPALELGRAGGSLRCHRHAGSPGAAG